jgi:hypothetical protein
MACSQSAKHIATWLLNIAPFRRHKGHSHDRDVPLADILPLLQQANVGGFVLPFANPRHQHEYRVLQKFPLADDQIIAAGVIDDLTGFVEHPEVVADRLENVARAVGDPRRVMAPAPIAASTPRPAWAGSPKTWCGPSSRQWPRVPASPRSGFSKVWKGGLQSITRLCVGQDERSCRDLVA